MDDNWTFDLSNDSLNEFNKLIKKLKIVHLMCQNLFIHIFARVGSSKDFKRKGFYMDDVQALKKVLQWYIAEELKR